MIRFENMETVCRDENINGIGGFRTESCVCIVSDDYKYVTVFDENRERIQVYPVTDRCMTVGKFARNYLNEDVVKVYMSDSDYTVIFTEEE